jgi:hypothetical protein
MSMSAGFHVTCANKDIRGNIIRVGGPGWSLSVHEMVVKIVTGQLRFMVKVGDADYDIGVRGEGQQAYLVIESTGQALHDLDGLLSC